ncbi:MAG: phosphate-starvation-inducible PsiE family protein [Sulfuricurvum sp.]|jgi:uncharacterized membrane protein (DUF373 family)|nr:phosphate-starvation-inducible PsiE family protein [Sulfuricurvum sp.]MDX9966925.1 phosphate-starvation-inducible PsiE family protein [Sulfuricurvum sp.]
MLSIGKRKQRPQNETTTFWGVMNLYEQFEQVVALILSAVISVTILVALWRLIIEVYEMLLLGVFNPLDHKVFQGVFGMIMTLLIAMEFKHSIVKVVYRKAHIIQVKTVILIAQLALARKFIILDFKETNAMQLSALAFAVLVLSIAHWLLKEQENVPNEE